MTVKNKIINYLKINPEPIDDDILTKKLGLKRRQHTNNCCRELETEGLIKRILINGKIHNVLNIYKKDNFANTIDFNYLSINDDNKNRWCWEGNIQNIIACYLEKNGYSIISTADTMSKQRGKDIVAEKEGQEIWITVKGYPKGTERTSPRTQAAHWFKDAIFDIVQYRNISDKAKLGIGLPDFKRYHNLATKTTWLKGRSPFNYFWVSENGDVIIE
jgi:hypothetical protein